MRLDPSQPRHAFFDESRVSKARSVPSDTGQSAPSVVSESAPPTEADKTEASETRDLLPHSEDGKQTSVELQGRRWRDAVLFVLGSAAAFLVLLASGHQPRPLYMPNDKLPVVEIGYSLAEPDGLMLGPCSEPASQLDNELNETWLGDEARVSARHPVVPAMAEVLDPPGPNWHMSSNQVSPYAYVLMAYDEPGKPAEHIWRAIAMARALQRLSQYPVLLLTNTTHLPDGTSVADTFWKLNTQVLPVYSVQLPPRLKHLVTPLWRVSFWKLQIWRLTQYEKLIWLDIDGVVFRNIDHLFQLKPVWGQRDAWVCSASNSNEDWLCSGMMLIEPSEEVYQGLLEYASKTYTDWWLHGDKKLIDEYYSQVLGQPVQFLDYTDAAFGKCIGTISNLFKGNTGSSWNIPAFVHKSSIENECFNFVISEQLREVEGTLVNVCHFHPLGPYWRDLFCDGLRILGVKTEATETFCDDFVWYRHR